ncbi:hypothetical protein, partial [Methylobacterium sp. WL19]|uniref:hypothetical protein n=1 Tax=Methylobacterium sp. WL19 TaxID=2603896 RepID=UPI001AEDC071
MNNKSFLCAISFMGILSSNYSYADNSLYEWCVNSYPNKTDWCSKQYSKPVPNDKSLETDNSNNISNKAKNEENNIIEAINARSKTTHEYVL